MNTKKIFLSTLINLKVKRQPFFDSKKIPNKRISLLYNVQSTQILFLLLCNFTGPEPMFLPTQL